MMSECILNFVKQISIKQDRLIKILIVWKLVMKQSLKQNPNVELYGTVKNVGCYRWFRIIVFESIATILLTYGIMCSMYMTPPYPLPESYQPVPNPGHSIFQSCALFLSLCFAGQLTGGHCNPAVTLSLLISRGNRITATVALIYIISQFSGSMIGGILSWVLIDDFTIPAIGIQNNSKLKTYFAQIFGTFFYCLFILIIVNDKTTFIRSNFWNYLLVPLMYYVARQYLLFNSRLTNQIDGLNPATSLALQVIYGIRYKDWAPIQTYWIFGTAPIVGALFCGIFFNLFYLPMFIRWKAKK